MTRRPRTSRKAENRLAALETDAADSRGTLIEVVWRDDRTGDLLDSDGTPTDPDPAALMVVINETVVMGRDRAESEGREILGPAEDTPPENDAVRVALEGDYP